MPLSTYLLVPLNDQGGFSDGILAPILQMVTASPFQFSDLLVFSHGWWTTETAAVVEYDRFNVEFTRCLIDPGQHRGVVRRPPGNYLATGIHWPSILSEDQSAVLNYAEALTYFTMRERADGVGQNGVYAILKMALTTPEGQPRAVVPRIHLLGHSFGCRVVCAALQKLLDKMRIPDGVQVNVVLLQAAYDQADFDEKGRYHHLVDPTLPLRFLVTTSQLDTSLAVWYPLADQIYDIVNHPGGAARVDGLAKTLMGIVHGGLLGGGVNLVKEISALGGGALQEAAAVERILSGREPLEVKIGRLISEILAKTGAPMNLALGAAGPTANARRLLPTQDLPIMKDWPGGDQVTLTQRLVVADLTELHRENPSTGINPFSGHHSDIYCPEIYRLLGAFLFG